ncbi:Sec-independent protein translocase protein TatB [Pelagibacterium lacus]|uniref:Sec-independent protein translocase protein TatB n=1 Tax=Pelagibacterium lacus TaxID=2282655 RepID=A0A369W3N1_9HYPH|nr:Sec-independent protein translocase protein TatB [Pelagibacterium lacus]RDE09296.1 twin-arginine translocase subunit TatB [Pelagibacterium lacus]
MLGLGWSEMLVIAVVVLIVVGPKDLPVMLRNLGRMMGTVRRMSNEFRREIDRAIAAEEFREAKKSISDPLKQTSADIAREFNTIRDGKVEPSGKLAPAEPGKESVVDEIKAQAGMAQLPAATATLQAQPAGPVEPPAAPSEPPAKARVKAAPRKAAATTTAAPAKRKAPAKKAAAAEAAASPAKKTTRKTTAAKTSPADAASAEKE